MSLKGALFNNKIDLREKSQVIYNNISNVIFNFDNETLNVIRIDLDINFFYRAQQARFTRDLY